VSAPVQAIYYDDVTSKPHEVLVSVREPNTLEVQLPDGERILWPLEHKGMAWERSSAQLRLSFGEHPRRVVVVRDPLFIQAFAMRMRYTGRQGVYDRMLGMARRGPLLFFLAVVGLMVAAYLWVLPWTAERMALLAPRTLDAQLGDAVFDEMRTTLDEDTTRSAQLQAFGDALHLGRDFHHRYHVVRSDELNAFALPGGHIVVFTGLLDKLDSAGQLAALLAHEGTHVERRHSTRMIVRNMAGGLFLSLLVGDANAVVAVVADNANTLRNMGYGRGLETEADTLGQRRMQEAGVDPQGMVALLDVLDREAHDMPEALAFLSSHPLTTERIRTATAQAAQLGEPAGTPKELPALFQALRASSAPPSSAE
jgi:Zn-dependent protease with chaperone function